MGKVLGNVDATRAAARSRRWALAAALWMMLVPLGLLVVRLVVPSDHLRIDTLAGSMVRGAVVHPAGSVAGIRDGDVVLAVNGRRVDELVRSAEHRGVRAGERLVYRVRSDGLRRDVPVTVGAGARIVDLLTPEFAGLVFGFALFALAGWLVRRRPEERAAHALLILAASLASGEIAYAGMFEPLDVWARPQFVGWSVACGWTFMQMGLATLLLAWTFPMPPRRFADHPWTAAALIPLAVVSVEGVIVATGHGSAQVIDRANFVVGWWFWGATMSAALIVAAVRWFRLRRDHLARRRIQIAMLGLSVSTAVLLLETATAVDIPDVLYLPGLACFPIAIAVAVSRRDWFELDVTLNRGLVATICGVVLLGVYLAAALLTARLTDGAGPLIALPAAGLVAVCFAPVRWRVQRFIDHRLFGTGGDPRLVFHRLGVRLAASDDPESLMAAVVLTATESLRLDYAAVQLRAGDVWQTVYERGQRSHDLETFDMIAGDTVVGRLVAAPRRDVKTLSPIDRELLADLASHSGVAARVAALVTDLRIAQQRLLIAREAERHRIHRDLHDSVGPSLVGLTLQLEVVAEMAQQTDWGELIARLHREAARTTQDVRRLVRDLRPAELDELGLPAAVAAAGARLDSPSGPRIECDAPPRWPELGHEVEDAAYKICLEAMTNCVRHSHATRCSVTLNVSGSDALQITIIDDGNGLGEHYIPGTGLASMRERAEALGGWLQIENAEAGGTRLDVQLPTPAFTP